MNISDPVEVSAVIAVCGVIVSAVLSTWVSKLVARRTNYLNVVTAERSKWIENLRSNIAKYSALAHTISYRSTTGSILDLTSPEMQTLLREMRDIRSYLKLQLNPHGEIDKNIIRLVDAIYDASRQTAVGLLLDTAEQLLIVHAQWLLKAEWEKVKAEASWSLNCWRKAREARRLSEYKEFATNMAPIATLDAMRHR